MPREIDEDLIEQTIRRVAEAKAQREHTPDDAGDDPIEQTIRRVAEAKAQREQTPDDAGDAIEQTIRRVAEAKAQREQTADDAGDDPIEQTIRRVAEAKAQREQTAGDTGDDAPAAPPPGTGEESEPADEPPAARGLVATPPAWSDEEDEAKEVEAPAPAVLTPRGMATPSTAKPAAPTTQPGELETRLEHAVRAIEAVARRLENLVPLLSQAAVGGAPPPAAPGAIPPPTADEDEDEGGAGAGLLRLPLSPPRPPIFRDPSPRTATAEQPEPEFIDARPIPKPLPPLQPQPEPRRGLDLLPRTYRVTVEDKRRGVDLVPLHRALLSMEGVRDMSLLSYNNGIAIVSLESTVDIEPDSLAASVSRAMSRPARAEQHNEHTLVVKLAED